MASRMTYLMRIFCATDGGMPQIPATDAFLAEARAQGVEMMREHPSNQTLLFDAHM